MAVNIAIMRYGGPCDGGPILIDQHTDPPAVIALPGLRCDHFYELREELRPDGNSDLSYHYSLAIKRVAFQDNWSDPPMDEAY